MRNELIYLVTRTGRTRNANGFSEDTEELTEIFAQIKSVKATEFYQAYSAGMNLAYIFAIDLDDYMLSQQVIDTTVVKPHAVIYNEVHYKIVRAYMTEIGTVELTCEEADHGNDL